MNSNRRRVIKGARATTIIVVAVVLLIGCIPLPGLFNNADGGPRPESRIGKRVTSDKPLAVGRSTLQDVRRVLHAPRYESPDGRVIAYEYQVVAGYLLWCGFMPEELSSDRFLLLKFNDAGRLAGFDVYSDQEKMLRDAGPGLQDKWMTARPRVRRTTTRPGTMPIGELNE
jgi:hypothetical protein